MTAFLETFFKLYPTATEKELAYYVKDGVLAPVSGDYVFSELVNPVFTEDGDNLKVSVSVKYLDNKSKMTQLFIVCCRLATGFVKDVGACLGCYICHFLTHLHGL